MYPIPQDRVGNAACRGDLDTVKDGLKEDPKYDNTNAWDWAARNSREDVVAYLIEQGKHFSKLATEWAVINGNINVTKMLLAYGVPYGSRARSWAITKGHAQIEEMLDTYTHLYETPPPRPESTQSAAIILPAAPKKSGVGSGRCRAPTQRAVNQPDITKFKQVNPFDGCE